MQKRYLLLLIVTFLCWTASFAFDYTVNFDYTKVSINNVAYNDSNYSDITNSVSEALLLGSLDLKLKNAAALKQINNEQLKSLDILPNKIQTIYGKNTLPCVLPVHLYGMTFYNTEFFCDRLFIQNNYISTLKKNSNLIENEGKVLVAKDNKLKIHAMGFTCIDNLLQLSENSTFELYCDHDVEIDNVSVPKDAKLMINARSIYVGDNGIQKHAEGYVELISREKMQSKVKSRSSVDKKLAIEGRTWWYKSNRRMIEETQEFGIRIGKELSLNGEKWNEVSICRYTKPHNAEATPQSISDSILIAYIKDDGRMVNSITLPNNSLMNLLYSNMIYSLSSYMIYGDDYENPQTLYTFGQIGEEGYYGRLNSPYLDKYTILEISEIINSNKTYKQYSTQPLNGFYLRDSYDYIEGIGHPSRLMLFPYGGGDTNSIGWEYPELTYVTDGEHNHVIYEAGGGMKLWEQAGVESITVDNEETQAEWYDLRGVKIAEPSAPGVYIRRMGSHIKKVVR